MFRITKIHYQGVLTCTLTEITCSGSHTFIMCVVGVWRNNYVAKHRPHTW